jgi:hypothetical protein
MSLFRLIVGWVYEDIGESRVKTVRKILSRRLDSKCIGNGPWNGLEACARYIIVYNVN